MTRENLSKSIDRSTEARKNKIERKKARNYASTLVSQNKNITPTC